MTALTLSIILVNYNERDHLGRVLEKLPLEFPVDTEIIVVDNASRDGSADFVRGRFPGVNLIESGGNLMYGKGNNLGMTRASGDWLLLLNPDVDWQPGQLAAFVATAQTKQNLGAAGPRILNPNNSVQRSAHHAFPSWLTIFADYCLPLQQILLRTSKHPDLDSVAQHNHSHPVAHMTGVCLLVRREVFVQTGGFDPAFTMYLEETEWQRRMVDVGFVNWLIGEMSITHYGSNQKAFAQANRHYLWGLWYYVDRHWRGPVKHLRLRKAIWLGTLLTLVLVLPLWPISLVLGRVGTRLRHYARQYFKLTTNLFSFPTRPPIVP